MSLLCFLITILVRNAISENLRYHGYMSRHQEIRRVAPELFVRAMFGGFANQFGWGFFGFGMIFFWVFAGLVNFDDAFRFSGELRTTTGQVIEVLDTSASENDTRVQKIKFSFVHPEKKVLPPAETVAGEDEHLIVAECYQTGTSLKSGQQVKVEFPADNPEKARIGGTRRGVFQVWVLLLVAIFPFVGLVFMVFGIRRGLAIWRLLNYSCLTYGVLINKEPTNTRINHQTVMKLTFSFETERGRSANVVARTHEYQHLVDEAEEPLLYNPFNPEESCLLDDIPGRPRLDEYGSLVSKDDEGLIKTLFVPAVALLINVLAIFLLSLLNYATSLKSL